MSRADELRPLQEGLVDMTDEERFERKFFEVAIQLAQKRKMTQKDFALKVFGYERAFYSVRGGSKKDQGPQSITLAQALRMASVIGWEFSDLIDYVAVQLQKEDRRKKKLQPDE